MFNSEYVKYQKEFYSTYSTDIEAPLTWAPGSEQPYNHALISCTVLENIVSIQAAQSTAFAGASYTLNCTVVSDFRPVVKWTGLDGNPVDTNPESNDVTMDEPVYSGNKTYVLLRFRALRTSQAGQYTCQSIVSSPLSVRTATKNVITTGK